MSDLSAASAPEEAAALSLAPGERTFATFLHLSSLASYLMPLAGIVLPIVLWNMKKGESPALDRHGREVLNFTMSYLIYGAVCLVLCLALIGFFLLWIWGLLVVVFPVIAAVKAGEGQFWKYPMTIRFL